MFVSFRPRLANNALDSQSKVVSLWCMNQVVTLFFFSLKMSSNKHADKLAEYASTFLKTHPSYSKAFLVTQMYHFFSLEALEVNHRLTQEFPHQLLHTIWVHLLLSKEEESQCHHLILEFIELYCDHYEDVKYYTYKACLNILEKVNSS